jgi:hypothetical protein
MKMFILVCGLALLSTSAFAEKSKVPFTCRFLGENDKVYGAAKREILSSTTVEVEENSSDTVVSTTYDGTSCSTKALNLSYGLGIDGLSLTLADGSVVELQSMSNSQLRLKFNKIDCLCGVGDGYTMTR